MSIDKKYCLAIIGVGSTTYFTDKDSSRVSSPLREPELEYLVDGATIVNYLPAKDTEDLFNWVIDGPMVDPTLKEISVCSGVSSSYVALDMWPMDKWLAATRHAIPKAQFGKVVRDHIEWEEVVPEPE